MRELGAVAAAVLAAALPGAGGQGHADAADSPATGSAATAADLAGTSRFVVRFAPGRDAADSGLKSAVEAVGGRLLGDQFALHAAVVELPGRMAAAVAGLPGIVAVVPDQAPRAPG